MPTPHPTRSPLTSPPARWALLVALCLTACSGAEPKPAPAPTSGLLGPAPAPAAPIRGIDTSRALAEVAGALPDTTDAVVVVDVQGVLLRFLSEGGGMMPEGWDPKPMLDQLSAFSRKRIGLDVVAVRRAVVALGDGGVAMLVDQQGALKATPDGFTLLKDDADTGPIYKLGGGTFAAAQSNAKGWVMLAPPRALARTMRTMRVTNAPSLAKAKRYAKMEALLAKLGPNLVSGVGAFASEPKPGFLGWPIPNGAAPERAAFAVTQSRLGFVAQGSPEALKAADAVVRKVLSKIRTEADEAVAFLDQLDALEGMGAIAVSHMARGLEAQLTPERQGDLLIVSAPLPPGLVQSLPLISGVGAAIAIPAFERYIQQAKTSEAVLNLKMLADGAAAYYYAEHYDTKGMPLPPHFPPSARSVPGAVRSCCAAQGGPDKDNDGRCDAMDLDAWKARGFMPYKFALSKPSNYIYEVVHNGKTGRDAALTLHAYGDLDCDGVTSEFVTHITINVADEVDISPIRPANPMRELE